MEAPAGPPPMIATSKFGVEESVIEAGGYRRPCRAGIPLLEASSETRKQHVPIPSLEDGVSLGGTRRSGSRTGVMPPRPLRLGRHEDEPRLAPRRPKRPHPHRCSAYPRGAPRGPRSAGNALGDRTG